MSDFIRRPKLGPKIDPEEVTPIVADHDARMTISEAAAYLDRTVRTITVWLLEGKLTQRRGTDGKRQVLRQEVVDLAANLPKQGRKAADLTHLPKDEGWMTLRECGQKYSHYVTYATWYNWARTGILRTEGRPRITNRMWIMQALRTHGFLTPVELDELQRLEKLDEAKPMTSVGVVPPLGLKGSAKPVLSAREQIKLGIRKKRIARSITKQARGKHAE